MFDWEMMEMVGIWVFVRVRKNLGRENNQIKIKELYDV